MVSPTLAAMSPKLKLMIGAATASSSFAKILPSPARCLESGRGAFNFVM
jgi:hypothetical protein